MSASAEIFRFPSRGADNASKGAWTNQEIADVYRCLDMFARHGLVVEAASGLSEEGDPWFAIEDVSSGDALIHIARIDGFFVVHVLDGETWSGETLRAALSQIDMGTLPGTDTGAAHHDNNAADGDDDRDGTHAFLRIVSAVVAVLTADVIASAVTHDAVASPLPPTGAPDAGDHGADGNKAVLDLPAVQASLPNADRQDAPSDPAASNLADKPLMLVKAEKLANGTDAPATVTAPMALATALPSDAVTADNAKAEEIVNTAKAQAIVAVTDHDDGIALSFTARGGDTVQVSYNENAYFMGTENKADTFLIILGKNDREVTTKVGNFEKGQDSLVIEQSGDLGTSSALITDLGVLVTNGAQQLTVIGQAAAEIHLSVQTTSLVVGG
ncbi:hypothetical protein CHU95_20400 [Niveispirillum lacus]|uniref:Uncharacterized protein n=1 Tax=Niveispirillum lacus TaxID=1981099 RepID=A0A255YQM0_9PROT|nr:hypothetical protein [Niveispirillum lacus]OYQ31509.1 hypothetical protein CHU95_20400 [Niveispirillum lacus]